jgi:hypothetical protein
MKTAKREKNSRATTYNLVDSVINQHYSNIITRENVMISDNLSGEKASNGYGGNLPLTTAYGYDSYRC